jgi:DNA topoisomerase VI subunit B
MPYIRLRFLFTALKSLSVSQLYGKNKHLKPFNYKPAQNITDAIHESRDENSMNIN